MLDREVKVGVTTTSDGTYCSRYCRYYDRDMPPRCLLFQLDLVNFQGQYVRPSTCKKSEVEVQNG